MTVVKSRFAPKENQFYETEPWAVDALFRVIGSQINQNTKFWEPSAGNHKISDTIKNHYPDNEVTTSDIVQYEREHDFILDFFSDKVIHDDIPDICDWIITNPPYGAGNRMAVKYAELALKKAKNVALLLTAKFDFGKTRQHLFKNNPQFFGKLNLIDRLSFFDDKTGTEDHAWYIWTEFENEHPKLFYEGK